MTPVEFVIGLADLVVGVAASASREHQAAILRVIESTRTRVLELPSLAADVRAAAEARRRELRDQDDTRPMATMPPDKAR